VHILVKGRIVASGGPELANELERDGYRAFAPLEPEPARRRLSGPTRSPIPSAETGASGPALPSALQRGLTCRRAERVRSQPKRSG
jgi:hypothetical protein